MPSARILRQEALAKPEFHALLREWIAADEDEMIGSEEVDERTPWLHIRDRGILFILHADTGRAAVKKYLQLVDLYGNNLTWEVVASQRGHMTALVFGPERIRITSFYLYKAHGQP